jgi:hypothetical protein
MELRHTIQPFLTVENPHATVVILVYHAKILMGNLL